MSDSTILTPPLETETNSSESIETPRPKRQKCEVFAQRLRLMRERCRETQADISVMLGYHSRGVAYGSWERGQNEPCLQDLIKLCKHFNVTADWLLGLDDKEQRPDTAACVCDIKAEFDVEVQKMRQDAKAASANLFMLNQRIEKLEANLK